VSTTTAAEASLINDVEFREELERIEYQDPGIESGADAFDAFDAGLPVSHAAQLFEVRTTNARRSANRTNLPSNSPRPRRRTSHSWLWRSCSCSWPV
jgi:hypothetical protein